MLSFIALILAGRFVVTTGPGEQFTRPFVRDSKILRREEKGASPGLSAIAYGALLAIVVVWLAAMSWGLGRLRPTVPETPKPRGPRVGGLRTA